MNAMRNNSKNILSLSVFVFLIITFHGKSQTIPENNYLSNDSIQAIASYNHALKLFEGHFFEESLSAAESALQSVFTLETSELHGDILTISGENLLMMDKYDNALVYLIRASGVFERVKSPKVIKVNERIGDIFSELKLYQKAGEYYDNTLQQLLKTDSMQSPSILEKSAYAHFQAENFATSALRYNELIDWTKKNNDNELFLRSLFQLSEIYLAGKEYEKNLETNHILLEFFKAQHNIQAMSLLYNNIGYTYVTMNNPAEALNAFLQAYELSSISLPLTQKTALLLTNIGICYQNLNETDNSLDYLNQALAIRKDSGEFDEAAVLENIIALIYLEKRDFYNAGIYSLNSIESAKKAMNPKILQECYHTYSRILKLGNDHIKALSYYELYLNIRDSLIMEQRLTEQELTRKLVDLEKTEKELRLVLADEELKELEMRNLHIEAEKRGKEIELLRRERELEQSEKQRLLQSYELTRERHEAEIRQKEIQTLERDREIQELLLKQKETEEKERLKEIRLLEIDKERQQLEIDKQKEAKKRVIWMLALSAMILILSVSGLYIVRKKNSILARQKIEIEEKNQDLEQKNEEILTQNEQIIKQSELIEEKNKNITDSIQYARRIQSAVLPPEDFLDGCFSDYFLFFKPKDIVSGDFYWSANKGQYRYVAAADCTGHGVPGAFMSMLGITLLNEIANHSSEVSSATVLNELKREVITALKQKGVEGEAKDGMDISLCIYDKKNKQLRYSGANNPLYLLRNGELTILPADKIPIGISDSSTESFTEHLIELSSNDTIYIFSDGFADQFGGPDGKKFKYNRFRETLKTIQKMSMLTQKQELEKIFENWKSNVDQIDDVLVIGFRI